MFIVNTYVPNSGQHLKRLDYRTNHWDQQLGQYLHKLNQSKPVVLMGDLNVAHGILDCHNFYTRPGFPDELLKKENNEYKGLSQLKKQAGCTPMERTSFEHNILQDGAFVDTFRHFHPLATGCFTYWSMRAGNRKVNRGLRLDYCVTSRSMLSSKAGEGGGEGDEEESSCKVQVVDSFLCDDVDEWPAFSDHSPMGARFLIVE